MRLNVIAISIEDPADHVVAAVLSELLDLTFGDGELTPPPHEDAKMAEIAEMATATPRAGTAPPSPSLAPTPPAAGDNGPGEPPARAAAVRAEAKTPASVPAKRKPGMLATEQERKHFQNMHGGAAKSEPRVINSGQVKEALRSMRPGDELVVSPPPRKTSGIQKMINEMRRAGTLDKRVCVEQDRENRTVRIAWYQDDEGG